MPLSLKQQLQLQGTPEIIDLLCELTARIDRLETALLQRPPATNSAGPAMPNREIVEELGHGWQIVRTPVLESHQTAQDGHSGPQASEPV